MGRPVFLRYSEVLRPQHSNIVAGISEVSARRTDFTDVMIESQVWHRYFILHLAYIFKRSSPPNDQALRLLVARMSERVSLKKSKDRLNLSNNLHLARYSSSLEVSQVASALAMGRNKLGNNSRIRSRQGFASPPLCEPREAYKSKRL